MKWHKTLILALVLIILGVAYFWDKSLIEKKKSREEEQQKVFPWTVEQLTAVSIQRPSGPLRLVKSGDENWRIEEPVQAAVDQNRMEGFLQGLLNARIERQIDEEPDELEPYGLEQPAVTITLKGKEPDVLKALQMGKLNPTEVYYYARVQGKGPVFLVMDSVHREATLDLFELRDKSVWEVPSKRVKQVSISSNEAQLTLMKDQEDKWRIIEPGKYLADGEAVDSLISGLSELSAVGFEDEPSKPLADLGLAPPQQEVVLRLKDPEEEQVLQIGREVTQEGDGEEHRNYVRAGDENPVILVDAEDLKDISIDVGDWRQKALVTFEPFRAVGLEISHDDEVLKFKKVGGDEWEIEGPRRVRADFSKLHDLLWSLKDARVSRFLEEQPDEFAWEDPKVEVTIWLQDIEDPQKVVIAGHTPDGEDLFAKGSAQEEAFAVNPELVKELRVSFEDMRDRRLLRFHPHHARRIEIVSKDRTVELARDGMQWRLVKPEKKDADRNKVGGLLWYLLEVKFQEEFPEGVDASVAGRDQPAISARVSGEDQEELGSLFIGKPSTDRPDLLYAWIGEEAVVYLLDEKVVEDLNRHVEEILSEEEPQ